MKRICSLLPLMVVLVASCAGDSNVDGAAIVARAKAATGGAQWDRIVVWYETGTAFAGDRPVEHYEHWEDFRSLAARNAGESPGEYMVFDGHVAYRCVQAQCTRLPDSDSAMFRNGSYAGSFGFFFPTRFPASYRFLGTRPVHGSRVDVVEVSPAGLNSIRLWIDHESHFITRIEYLDGEAATELSDYRKVGGVTVPFVATSGTTIIRTETLGFEPARPVSFSPSSMQRPKGAE